MKRYYPNRTTHPNQILNVEDLYVGLDILWCIEGLNGEVNKVNGLIGDVCLNVTPPKIHVFFAGLNNTDADTGFITLVEAGIVPNEEGYWVIDQWLEKNTQEGSGQ